MLTRAFLAIAMMAASICIPIAQSRHSGAGAQGMAEGDPGQGIYVAAADGSGSVRLVENASNPAPSPDGTLIAFTQYGPGGTGIFVVGWDGSNPRQIASTNGIPLKPSWSPDGTRIAFLSYTDTYAQLLSVVNSDGSGLIDLTTLGVTYPSRPSWSADGLQIAFAGPGVGGSDLWVINADGSNPRLLVENPGEVEGPAFSPDGSLISFAQKNYEGQMSNSSHVIKPDGTGLITLTQWTAEQDPGPSNIAISSTNGAVWSPDSTRVAFPTIYGIAIANIDGSGVEIVADDPDLYCDIWDLSWSPDGSQFAVSRYCEGAESPLEPGSAMPTGEYNDIYVMTIDGSNVTLVGATMLVDVWPSWSPDGTRIVFTNEGAGD